MDMCVIVFIFFFKQKTAYEMRISDWSSDVCSSDLCAAAARYCRAPTDGGSGGSPERRPRCGGESRAGGGAALRPDPRRTGGRCRGSAAARDRADRKSVG